MLLVGFIIYIDLDSYHFVITVHLKDVESLAQHMKLIFFNYTLHIELDISVFQWLNMVYNLSLPNHL